MVRASLEGAGGVAYFTGIDRGDSEIDLSGFTLNAMESETGRPGGATAGIQIIFGISKGLVADLSLQFRLLAL